MWGPRQEQIPWLQGEPVTDPVQQVGRGPDHIPSVTVLLHLSVYGEPETQILGVGNQVFGKELADWARRVKPLSNGPRESGFFGFALGNAIRHIQGQAVTSNIVHSLGFWNILSRFGYHNTKLHLVVNLLGS